VTCCYDYKRAIYLLADTDVVTDAAKAKAETLAELSGKIPWSAERIARRINELQREIDRADEEMDQAFQAEESEGA
jgi:hypothetical protein